jgi:FkbM family methyltransferase
MVALRSLIYWAKFVVDCHCSSNDATLKVLVNKTAFVAEYAIHRIFNSKSKFKRDWSKFPFSLSRCVKWSRELSAWYSMEDLSSVISMEGAGSEPQEWLLRGLSPGMVVIDVGAHHGRYSVCASRKVGETGLVVAIEPHPRSIEVLRKNLDLNDIKNVRIFSLACWSERADLHSINSSSLALHSVVVRPDSASTLTGIPLDDVIEHMGVSRVDWIKIDVEGTELAVLGGAEKTIEAFHPRLYMEFHQTLPAMRDWLFQRGYVIRHQTEDPHAAGYGWIMALPTPEA